MILDLIQIMKSNGVIAYEQYPQGNVPKEFIKIKSMGISSERNGVNTFNYEIEINSMYSIEELNIKVIDILKNKVLNIPGIGNTSINNQSETQFVNGVKKIVFDYSIDKIRWI